jgi:hypothetical protein
MLANAGRRGRSESARIVTGRRGASGEIDRNLVPIYTRSDLRAAIGLKRLVIDRKRHGSGPKKLAKSRATRKDVVRGADDVAAVAEVAVGAAMIAKAIAAESAVSNVGANVVSDTNAAARAKNV